MSTAIAITSAVPFTLTNAKGEYVCGSKLRNKSKLCQQTIIDPDNGRCVLHGGTSLAGIASPRTKTGRHSKYLLSNQSLLDKYQQAQADSRLLVLRDEISLVDARLGELIETISTGESMRNWIRVAEQYTALKSAMQAQDTARLVRSLEALDTLIAGGARDSETWAEIHTVIEQRRRLVESERKRLVEMQQMITAERATLIFAQILDVIRENVSDRDALQRIGKQLEQLAAAQTRD